jgi:Prp8 binding protein
MPEKRKDIVLQTQPQKKTKTTVSNEIYRPIKRVSDLSSPIMQLSGHKGQVETCKFSHNEKMIATGSFDKTILLWDAYEECKNFGKLCGHDGAILEVDWSRDDKFLYSCSSDMTGAYWDIERGEIIKRFRGHKSIINSLRVSKRGYEMVCTASDDGIVKLWDTRQRNPVHQLVTDYPLTSVEFSIDGGVVFVSGVDSDILVINY